MFQELITEINEVYYIKDFEILKIERSQYEETYKKGIITHHVHLMY